MIEIAFKLSIYLEIYECMIGLDVFPDILKGRYGCAVASGCFLNGHFPADAIPLMLDSIKIGGLLIFTIRDNYYELGSPMKYREMFETLKERYELIDRIEYLKYPGIKAEDDCADIKETPASVMILKRLQ